MGNIGVLDVIILVVAALIVGVMGLGLVRWIRKYFTR